MDDIDAKLAEMQRTIDKIGPPPAHSGLYFSLHRADPQAYGGSEISGGSYSRQPMEMQPTGGTFLENAEPLIFVGMPPGLVTHFGIWDDKHTGHLLVSGSFSRDVDARPGDTFAVNPGDFKTDVRLDLFVGKPVRTPDRRGMRPRPRWSPG